MRRRELDYHRWKKNGAMIHVGNGVEDGQIVPAMIVAVWGDTPESAVDQKCFLDGRDDYWLMSTTVGAPDHGKYHTRSGRRPRPRRALFKKRPQQEG